MKVTPVNRKFGKHRPGDVFEFPDKAARAFIRAGKLAASDAALTYRTRMLTAAAPAPIQTAPVELVEKEEPAEAVAEAAEAEAETSAAPDPVIDAPYGLKTDGTPRKRPGRAAKQD